MVGREDLNFDPSAYLQNRMWAFPMNFCFRSYLQQLPVAGDWFKVLHLVNLGLVFFFFNSFPFLPIWRPVAPCIAPMSNCCRKRRVAPAPHWPVCRSCPLQAVPPALYCDSKVLRDVFADGSPSAESPPPPSEWWVRLLPVLILYTVYQWS